MARGRGTKPTSHRDSGAAAAIIPPLMPVLRPSATIDLEALSVQGAAVLEDEQEHADAAVDLLVRPVAIAPGKVMAP